MRVDLVVPADEFLESAAAIWQGFLCAVEPVRFPALDPEPRTIVNSHAGLPGGAFANAAWIPPGRVMPEYAEFCLSEAFFQQADAAQVVVLLHEALHIGLYRGRLTQNYRLIREQPRFSNAATPFEVDRENLSWETLTFPQEVGVDKLLPTLDCSDVIREQYFDKRAHYYKNGEGHQYDDQRSPSLAVYRLFYRLLRTELGIRVTMDANDRGELEALRVLRDDELQRTAGNELQWFRDVQQKCLGITVETYTPDPDPYRELFDRIRNLPSP